MYNVFGFVRNPQLTEWMEFITSDMIDKQDFHNILYDMPSEDYFLILIFEHGFQILFYFSQPLSMLKSAGRQRTRRPVLAL